MRIIQAILRHNPCCVFGQQIVPRGLMLHSVGTPQPNAENFVSLWNSPNYTRACVHAFIDGNTGDVYQTLPWNWRGWHAGGSANNTHIGVEMCEPATIRYRDNSAEFEDLSPAETEAVVRRTYRSAVQLFADLCAEYNLDPLADGAILSHSEGNRRGIASAHADPEHLWNRFRLTMDGFRKEVAEAMQKDRYNTIGEIPDWGRPTAQKLIDRGLLRGNGDGLDLSRDMLRILVILDRAGNFGK